MTHALLNERDNKVNVNLARLGVGRIVTLFSNYSESPIIIENSESPSSN